MVGPPARVSRARAWTLLHIIMDMDADDVDRGSDDDAMNEVGQSCTGMLHIIMDPHGSRIR